MDDDVLTPDEIAAAYRITGTSVRRWCVSGKLKALKVGKQWRIKRRDLDAFLAQQGQERDQDSPKANGPAVTPARPLIAAL